MEPQWRTFFDPWFRIPRLQFIMELCFNPWFDEPNKLSQEPRRRFCFSSQFSISREDWLPILLNRLISLDCNQHLLSTKWKEDLFKFRGFIVGEFVRQKLLNDYSGWKLPNRHKSIATTEVELWIRVYDLIEEVFNYYPPGTYEHPAFLFYKIIQEQALVLFRNFKSSDNKAKEDFIKRIRRQNQQLLTLEANPFDCQTALHTWQLIGYAITIADQGRARTFRSEIFTPMVKARMALTTVVAAPESILLIDGEYGVDSKNKSGRKPKKTEQQKAKNKNKNFNTSSEIFSRKGFQR